MSEISFREDIQGLRAIAVLAVIIFHLNSNWLPGGFVGVDIFLVISGFLITSILLKKRLQPDYNLSASLKYFYFSRIARIVPAYIVMLIITGLAAAVIFLPQDFNTFKKSLEEAIWFNSNNYFADFGDYFAPVNYEQPLLHTWSLAVEMQFYLLAPFLVLLLPLKFLKWFFILLLVSLTLLVEYRIRILGVEHATYFSLYARLPEFIAGALAALYLRSSQKKHLTCLNWLSILGICLILLSVIAQPTLGPFPGITTMLPLTGSVLIICTSGYGVVNKMLSCKLIVWVGAISYSLYLWHWPVLAFLRYYSGVEVLNLELSILFMTLTLLLSLGSYYWVEKFFRSPQVEMKKTLAWILLIAATFGTSQSLGKFNQVFTEKLLPVEYRRYADEAAICHGKIVDECLFGDVSSSNEVLVLGDSHAAMLNYFFDYIGRELGFRARVITASNCVTIPGFDYKRIPEWAHQPCLAQIMEANSYIENAKTIFMIGFWSAHHSSEDFKTALNLFIDSNADKRLIILSQIPQFKLDINRVKRFLYIGLPAKITRKNKYKIANDSLAELSKGNKNVEFWYLDNLMVFDNAPFFNNQQIYLDDHHVNEIGARVYAEAAIQYFDNLVFN